MRILALIPGGIGDQILFFPTIETLKHRYANAIIDVMVDPQAKTAYRLCPNVNEVLSFDFGDRQGLADYLNLLGKIRDREYDLAVTLDNSLILNFLLWLNGIPSRIGFENPNGWLLTQEIERKWDQYQGQSYCDLLSPLGVGCATALPSVKVSTDDIAWAENQQALLQLQETGYVLLHGFAGQLSNQEFDPAYPIPKWHSVIQGIQEKQPNLPIVLLQTKENMEWAQELMALVPSLKVVSPGDIGKSAAIMAGANLMVATEGALVQLAIAVGTYTIGLFGPSQAQQWLPQDDKFKGIQSPTRWLADIAPEVVLQTIWG